MAEIKHRKRTVRDLMGEPGDSAFATKSNEALYQQYLAQAVSKGLANPDGTLTDAGGQNKSTYDSKAEDTAQSAQDAIDRQTAANRPNQYGPFASTTWSEGADGTMGQHVNFSGPLGDAAKSLQQQLADQWSKPFDDGSAVRQETIDAMYGQAKSRLDPMWEQREHGQQSQLANQGLDMHSEAYRNATSQLGRDRNDAYSSAMNNAIGMGNQAQALTFNQNLQARMAPLQGMQGLQGLSNPYGFNAAGNSGGVDYLGAWESQQNRALDREKMNTQATTDAISGASHAATAGAGYSDERVKFDIHDTGMRGVDGLPLKSFRYNQDPKHEYLGYIAQDVEKVAPDQVSQDPFGLKMVSPEFAPVPVGGGTGEKTSGWDFLSPESKQLTASTSTSAEKRKALERQHAMAAALRNSTGKQVHTSPLGAALGGIGDFLNAYRATNMEQDASSGDRKLTAQQERAFQENAEAEAQSRKQMALVEALRQRSQAPRAPVRYSGFSGFQQNEDPEFISGR